MASQNEIISDKNTYSHVEYGSDHDIKKPSEGVHTTNE